MDRLAERLGPSPDGWVPNLTPHSQELAADAAVIEGVVARVNDCTEWELLSSRDLDGLVVAQACVLGHANAVRLFEQHYITKLAPAIASINPEQAFVEEVLQRLRERCLVSGSDGSPALARFEGRSRLSTYLRVAATRQALALRQHPHTVSPSQIDLEASQHSPELALVKHQYKGVFEECFRAALRSLAAADRNLLRYHYFHGLTHQRLAELRGTSKSAIGRRLEKLRDTLLSDTRRCMAAKLTTSKHDFEQVMALIASQIELSIERHMTPTQA